MIWWVAAALAQDPPPEPLKWSGLGLPLVGVNTIDGWGFGVAGEVYGRPPAVEYGYRLKFTVQLWATTRLDYTNDFVQIESRGDTIVTGRGGYRAWSNLSYAGVGGDAVAVLHGDVLERGNTVAGAVGFLGGARRVGDINGGPIELYGQVYLRQVRAIAGPGTILERESPFGLGDGAFADVTLGVRLDTTDRWPMPTSGWKVEAAPSIGVTVLDDATPVGGILLNAVRWVPLLDRRLVLGGRLLAMGTTGTRPFWEKEMTGGVWRNELGMETSFTGYGRARTRGDSVVAALMEVRPQLYEHGGQFWDFSVHASLFAEQGWLFDAGGPNVPFGGDPGPPLPTVGGGPLVLWQKAILLRPFVAWGWTAAGPGQERRPSLQYSVSFVDPL